jgi:carbonic anhydrase
LKKLIAGVIEFRKKLTPDYRKLFSTLTLGQKPDALFIACSDSRVVPNLFASTNPGDLFVVRNVGNLVPPCNSPALSIAAALEFAVLVLKVSDIIICGHSECGAIRALVANSQQTTYAHLSTWLEYGTKALEKIQHGETLDSNLSLSDQISQVNVLQQMEHLKTYPFVQERIENNTLRIHGWWFDIANVEVLYYCPNTQKFLLIDENLLQTI